MKRLLIPTVWLLLASLCAASEPTPAPKAVLQRVQFSAGTIGFRTTDSHYDRYLWSVSPKEAEASFWAVKLDPSGEPVALCGYAKPYVVVFVAMTDTGGDVAVVRVSGTDYTVGVGDTFAGSYQVVSLTDTGGTFLFGDSPFTLAVGEEILK